VSNDKRTGSRDISELKQRLGLKKAAPATGVTPGGRGNGTGGVVPPPGLNLPPPPGAQPPQPVIPNAADDPFAAMNAMAQIGTVQRAPEIIIVNDGKPVESVHGSSARSRVLLMIAIPGVVALLIGLTIGRISKDANVYNDGLKGAQELLGEEKSPAPSTVRQLKKALADLDTQLVNMQKNGFHTDSAASKELDKLSKLLEVKAVVYPLARNITTDGDLAGQVLSFYATVNEVKAMLDSHLRTAKLDEVEAQAAAKAAEAKLDPGTNTELASRYRYAVLMSAATDNDKNAAFGAKLVEIGQPYCGDKMSTSGKCPEGEGTNAVAYRTDPQGTVWTKGERAQPQADAVPTKQIVALIDTPVLDTITKGLEIGPSSFVYAKRLALLYELVHGNPQKNTKGLVDEGNRVETGLEVFARKGSRFTFFL
jgi:hypothetical protein